jgi:N-acetylgalactosamine-6-sulfatase
MAAVRLGDWKLLHNESIQRTELYNISQDPLESKNRTHEKPDKVIELKALWKKWKQTLPE